MSEYTTVVIRDAKDPIQLGNLLLGGVVSAAHEGDLVSDNMSLEEDYGRILAAQDAKHREIKAAATLKASAAQAEIERLHAALKEARNALNRQAAHPDAALVEALEQIIRQYPNPDVSHVDFRVHACKHAEHALAEYRAALAGKGATK